MDRPNITPWKTVFALLVLFSGKAVAVDIDPSDTPESQPVQQINQVMADFRYSLEIQNYPLALEEANQVVTLFDGTKQLKDQAMALHNLSKVQQFMGLHLKSEKSYQKSIHIIESHKGVFAPELLTSLNHLGSLYYHNSNYELSIDAFRRAQHITHRNAGVDSLEQLKFIDWITLIDVNSSRLKDADKQQRFYYTINVQNYGEDDPRMLPAMNKMADWFKASGQLREARSTYEKALAVIEKYGLGVTERLKPLRGLSTVIYLKGSCCADAPLGEALQIVMTDPGSDHVDKLDALVHLADMHMIRKKGGTAKKYYQHAWHRLGIENPLTRELFGTPELLGVSRVEDVHKAYYQTVEGRSQLNKTVYRMKNQNQGSFHFAYSKKQKVPLMSIIGEPLSLCHSQALELAHTSDTQDLQQYFVNVNFTVTSEGGVRNVSLMDSNAPTRLQRYVTNTLRQVRYRPTFHEGLAVDTKNITLHQTFPADNTMQVVQNSFNRTGVDGKRAASLGCQLLASRG